MRIYELKRFQFIYVGIGVKFNFTMWFLFNIAQKYISIQFSIMFTRGFMILWVPYRYLCHL